MTTIDEIIEQARHLARVTSAANRSGKWPSPEKIASRDGAENALRTLITQTLSEARADGAREMRDVAAAAGYASAAERDGHDVFNAILALPLPAKREPVRLTDEQIARALHATTGDLEMGIDFSA